MHSLRSTVLPSLLSVLVALAAAAHSALVVLEVGVAPDGAEYVLLENQSTSSINLQDFSYSFSVGEQIADGSASFSNSPFTIASTEQVLISRLPQFIFDIVHGVNSSSVAAFIYNSSLDLSLDSALSVSVSATHHTTHYSIPFNQRFSLVAHDNSYNPTHLIPVSRALVQSTNFPTTGNPIYGLSIPEPSVGLTFSLVALS